MHEKGNKKAGGINSEEQSSNKRIQRSRYERMIKAPNKLDL